MVFILWFSSNGEGLLWKLPDGRDWLRGKLGLVLMGRGILSKSLIQFSVDGQDSIPSLRPKYVGGNENNADLLQQIPCKHCRTQCLQSCTKPPLTTPLPETPGHSRASLGPFFDHCSFLLSPGAHNILFVPSKSLLPQSCVSSGSSMVGLMATSSRRAYAIPRSTAPRAPAPAAGHCWSVPLQETLRHSSVSVSVGPLGPGAHKVCLRPLRVSGEYGVWFSMGQFCPSYHLAGASPLPLDRGYLLKVALAPLHCSSHTYCPAGASQRRGEEKRGHSAP